jgi:hypothetical protein
VGDTLNAEHARLQRRTDELYEAHKRLRVESPKYDSAHFAHRASLQRHINELHDHLERLKRGK